jgi:hypothetical protein
MSLMRKTYIYYNRRTGKYELWLRMPHPWLDRAVFRNGNMNAVYNYAERNGYDLVEYD